MSSLWRLGAWPEGMRIGHSSSVGNGTEYPVGVSLKQATYWFYRVKAWQVDLSTGSYSATITFTDEDDVVHSASTNGPATFVETPISQAETENDLLSPGFPVDTAGASGGSSDFGDEVVAQCLAASGVRMFRSIGDQDQIRFWDGLWYPRIEIALDQTLYVSGGINYNKTILASGITSGTDVQCTIDGEEFTMGWNSSTLVNDPFGEEGDSISESLGAALNGWTVNITPYRYWPYDPGDGLGPIFDEITGASLRNPHKIVLRNGVVTVLP